MLNSSQTIDPQDLPLTGRQEHEAAKVVDSLINRLGADAAFGNPISSNGHVLIPVAEISTRFGFGLGRERKISAKHNGDEERGRGGGSGGLAHVTPIGYIRVDDNKVSYIPIINKSRLTLFAMGLGSLLIWLVSRSFRP